ncbi:uncharacterized protein LOC126550608 isoform X1 [Aphis gossypii]|uniref:uncharacterized protein LOC126550608 isoform X1 n=1 Tax=Aphis gossypii TaxID=80765 RepID=UPI002158A766|nr:uncharacterized protein LOC126550608 isoform X1 [Aphis gossypii]
MIHFDCFLDAVMDEHKENDDDDDCYVTVMPDDFDTPEPESTTVLYSTQTELWSDQDASTSKDQELNVITPQHFTSNAKQTELWSDQGASSSKKLQWNFVTPHNLKYKKSTPLRSNNKRLKSRTAEATKLLNHKDQLTELQIKCLEQEFKINEVKKRNVILEEQKLKLEIEKMLLEIEVLKKKNKDP